MKTLQMEELAQQFLRDGYLILPQLLLPAEVKALQQDTATIVNGGYVGKEPQSDYFHDILPDTGEDVFHRVQYVFPKAPDNSLLILLGQPVLLALVHYLLGDAFVCEAEALVFKMPKNGREVPVHADCDPADSRLAPLIFNVDYYLDDSTVENGCLYVAPGSHKSGESSHEIAEKGFAYPGLMPLTLRAGDVVLHDTRLVHGSLRSSGHALRRTLYYEFQSMDDMVRQGGPRPGFPMTDVFIRDRFRLLMHAIDARKACEYTQGEIAYNYRPPAHYHIAWPQPGEEINLRPALGYNKYI